MRSSNRGVLVLGLILISTITPVSSQVLLTLLYENTSSVNVYTFVFNSKTFPTFYNCLCGELTDHCIAHYKNLENPPINIINVETVSAESDLQDSTNYYECTNRAFRNHVICKRLDQSEIACGAEKKFTTLPRPSSSSCGNTCVGLKWFNPDMEYFSYNSVNESKGPCNQSCYEITYTTPLTTTDATTTDTKTSTASTTSTPETTVTSTTLTTTKVETTETQATTSTAPSTMLSTPTTTKMRTTTTIISTQPQTTSPTEAKATTSVPVTTMTSTTVTTTPVTTTETQTTTSTAPSTMLITPTTTITSTQTPSPTEPKTTTNVPVTTMTPTTVTTTPVTTTEPQTTSQTTVKPTTAMTTSTVPNTTVSPTTTTTSATTVTLTTNITSTETQTLTTIMSNTTTASVTNIFDEFNQDDDDDDVPLIVGLVVGCLLLALLVAIIVIVIFRRQKMRDYKTSTESLAPEHHDSDILNDGSAESYPQNRNGDMKYVSNGDLSRADIPNNDKPPDFSYIPKSNELPMYTSLPPGPQKYRIFSTQEIPFYTIVDISNNDSSQPTEWKENNTVNDTSSKGNDQGNVTLPDSSGQMTKL